MRPLGSCEERLPASDVLAFDLVSGGVYDNPVVVTAEGVFGTARFAVE